MSPASVAVRFYERVRGGGHAASDATPFARRLRAAARVAALVEADPKPAKRRTVRAAVALDARPADTHRDLARHTVPPRHRRGAIAALRARARETTQPSLKPIVITGAVLVVIAAVLVWIRLQVVGVGYQLSTGRQVEQQLEQEQRELALEIATLSSPRRLEEVARERLGMGPPAPGQIITAP